MVDFSSIFTFFSNKWTLFLPIIPIYWPIIQFLKNKNREEKHKRFENYHKLIDDLFRDPLILEKQIAILYELRKFNDYHPITLRILKGLLSGAWENAHINLKTEAQMTINFIKSNWVKRNLNF